MGIEQISEIDACAYNCEYVIREFFSKTRGKTDFVRAHPCPGYNIIGLNRLLCCCDPVISSQTFRQGLGRHIEELIGRAERHWKRLDEGGADNEEAFSNTIKDILDRLDTNAEFSAFAKMMVDKHRDKECLADVA